MLFVTILSYIVPSGEFVRSTDAQGNEVVDPDQFNFIEQADNISLFDFFTAIYNGFSGRLYRYRCPLHFLRNDQSY